MKLTGQFIALWRELVEPWPDAHDSDVTPDLESRSSAARLQARLSYRGSLAYFDEYVARDPETFNAEGKGGRVKTFLGILQNKDTAYPNGT